LLIIIRSGHARRAIAYQNGWTLHAASEAIRSRTPPFRERTQERTNAGSAARMTHSAIKTGSEIFPLRSGQNRANGKITQNRTRKIPHLLKGGMPVDRGFRIPSTAIAPRAGPNAPITPISIRYVGFFTGAMSGTAQTIQELAKAMRKNATIGWRRILSDHELGIRITRV
jgi:hypothetical protein